MTAYPWNAIDDFQSPSEFDRFVAWIMNRVAIGEAVEVEVSAPYLDAPAFTEKWFKHLGSGEIWRMVWPDGPFTGLFERVS